MTREITLGWIERWGVPPEVAARMLQNIIDGQGPGLLYKRKKGPIYNAKYTEEEVKFVCLLLQERPHLSLRQVSRLTKVGFRTVETIYRRQAWTDISIEYDFSRHKEAFKKYCKGTCQQYYETKGKDFEPPKDDGRKIVVPPIPKPFMLYGG